jgi:O-methyltransferase
MISRIAKFVASPGKTWERGMQKLLFKLTPALRNRAFFLQGQMDIHPKSKWHREDFVERNGGFFLKNDPVAREIAPFHAYDLVRRDMLVLLCRSLVERKIEGDVAELGVYKGVTAKLFHYYLRDRQLHLFDTFGGFDARDVEAEAQRTGLKATTKQFSDTSLEAVRKYVSPRNDNVHFYQGFFPGTVPIWLHDHKFALVHLDADLYEPILAGLRFFYERMSRGGYLIVHDYNAWAGARQAVTEFMADKVEVPVPMPDKSGSALIVKQ